jgi:hypothetical protein
MEFGTHKMSEKYFSITDSIYTHSLVRSGASPHDLARECPQLVPSSHTNHPALHAHHATLSWDNHAEETMPQERHEEESWRGRECDQRPYFIAVHGP